ncbi:MULTISPECIES: mevalonate kinase [Bacillati]|jgi:mevalonate kinase (EC 2.7.1.36)|uniref:Mevalonate kinase n=1 Tax=Streptococcus mutans serotype c (strain ATCC 700610 / UA159) TaxID=210007 RepID=Q8DW87_STRMU|nr:mevalonate kinase [Streptococcus mutans]AAN57956.1 putative mevalonate kinase [Streptococcus mutans UA159]AJD54627.1 mevalonate kinase [Streptococcus mutans UA159-FR]EMB59088.1 mevalonate kinase [Streptococcus mutans 8ID3]EMB80530.1 mevalonate kinase [Streptococcus mutans NFSM2]EMC12880.1 mevalonate kinase [Streptococcus mutans N66]
MIDSQLKEKRKVIIEKKIALGKASGKIILMGEHAVVYGQPAIAIPFSAVETVAEVKEDGEALTVTCEFYDGLVHKMPEILESLKHAIRFSLYRIGAPQDPAIHIDIHSTIPAERGMGSSAAVAVAIARSLFNFYGKVLTDKELWEIVQSSEKIAHGNPSGIDTVTTSGKSPVFFVKDQPIEQLSINMDAYLIVADTGQTGQTLKAIQSVKALLSKVTYQIDSLSDPKQAIKELGQLTKLAKEALLNNYILELGEVMNQAHQLLASLTVSNQTLDRLAQAARQAGALGAKLTGGGRGGCLIALAKDKESAEKIARSLLEQGAKQAWCQYLGNL